MIKGQTIIELRDESGQIERYIDDNLITNAFEKYLNTCGMLNNVDMDVTNIAQTMFGGVLLFENEIAENVSTVFPPSNNKMVGNGCVGVLSSDSVSEMGSYNENESGWQQDGSYTQVYDFTTSQANGTISCICLSSELGGYIGFGNENSNNEKSTKRDVFSLAGSVNFKGIYADGYEVARCDYVASTVDLLKSSELSYSNEDYCITTKKLHIYKKFIPLTKVRPDMSRTNFPSVSTTEVTIPDEFIASAHESSRNNLSKTIDSQGNIYLYFNDSYIDWTSSIPLKILKIATNNTVSIITLQNTIGEDISKYSYFHPLFEGNYMVFADANNEYIYRVNLSDSSSIDMLNINQYWNYQRYTQVSGIIIFEDKIIDVAGGRVLPYNGRINYKCIKVQNHPLLFIDADVISINIRRTNYYLASINNLETAVVKDASKTMKLTYRLTFEESGN